MSEQIGDEILIFHDFYEFSKERDQIYYPAFYYKKNSRYAQK